VVRDPRIRQQVVERVRAFGVNVLGLTWVGICESPLIGPAGNVEVSRVLEEAMKTIGTIINVRKPEAADTLKRLVVKTKALGLKLSSPAMPLRCCTISSR